MTVSTASTEAQRQYEWRQVSSCEYRRPLFANELFLAVKSLFDGTCTMISTLSLKGATLIDVEYAWQRMPLLLPMLRMQLHRFDQEGKDELEFSYNTPEEPDAELKKWKDRTLIVVNGLSQEDVQAKAVQGRNDLRPPSKPGHSDVARLYVSQCEKSVHLVFSFQHAITDARGQWMMVDLFLKLCSGEMIINASDVSWGVDDVSRLPRPFHHQAGLRTDGDVPPFDALEMIHKDIADDILLAPFAGFPVVPDATPSAAVHNAAPVKVLSIPAVDYTMLHAVAKSKQCTASAWVGAVLTLLLHKFNVVEGAKTLRFPIQPVDARRYMPANSEAYFGVAIGGGNVDMADLATYDTVFEEMSQEEAIPESFWAVAREYKGGLEKLMFAKKSVLAAKEIIPIICPYVLADPLIGDMSSVFYTSLGRVKTYINGQYGGRRDGQLSIEVEDIVTFPLFHNTMLTMCSLLEFKGELRIVYQIPNNTHSEAFAAQFASELHRMVEQLIEGAKTSLQESLPS